MKPVRSAGLACLLALTVLAAGCSRKPASSFSPSESSLYVTGEGTVTSADIESYTNDYYTEEELKASVEEALAAFGEGASLNSVSLKDNQAGLLLDFTTPAEYLRFVGMYPDEESPVQVSSLDIADVESAASAGRFAELTFTSPDGKEASAEDVAKLKRCKAVFVEGTALIQTDGAIQYVSGGVSVEGDSQARTASEGVSCIVFK